MPLGLQVLVPIDKSLHGIPGENRTVAATNLQRFKQMKLCLPFIPGMALILTCGLQTASAQQDGSPMQNIGAGSQFVVGETAIVLPANENFVYFQNGALSTATDVDYSQPNCRLQITKGP